MSSRKSFRFVVVGAGSAGCHVALRLSELQNQPVALIEAGSQHAARDVRSVVPSYYPRTFGSSLDWNFTTVPQAGLGGRRLAWPRGKLLGGSGAINALIWMEPAQADWANWGLTPAQSLTEPEMRDHRHSNGTENSLGMQLNSLATPHPWSRSFLQSATNCGLTLHEPWRQARSATCGLYQLTQLRGRRFHVGIKLSQQTNDSTRSKLTMICQAHARRIVLSGRRAIGVEIEQHNGQLETIYASEQVILCCGTIGSPMLLMQSGIGDPHVLANSDSPCLHPLPWVGKNLQDHLVLPVIFSTHEAIGLARRHSPTVRQEYRMHGTGGLASNIAEAGALFSTPAGCATNASAASIVNLVPEGAPTHEKPPEFQLHFTPTHYLKYPRLATGDRFCSLGISDLHPRSRGELTLERNQCGLSPRIDPAYLSDPADCSRLLQALHWTRELAASHGLHKVICSEVMPGPKRVDRQSLIKWMRAFAQTIFHPVGTCRMDCGPDSGVELSVVDRDFRVHGIDGLRIIDASVLPSLPSCNTNAATLEIAERGALKVVCA